MKPQEVLIFHNILWSHYTGVVFGHLSAELCKHNGSIFVVHVADSMESRKGIGEVDKRYHQYPYRVLFPGSIEQAGKWQQLLAGIKILTASKATDVMVFGYDLPIYVLAILLSPLLGKRLHIVADATAYDRARQAWKEKLKALLLRRAATVICYGQAHRQYLMSLGVPAAKIAIRLQATDNAQVRYLYQQYLQAQANADPTVQRSFVFIGRLIEEKNLFALLQAFEQLNSNWVLKIVGSGVQEPLLKAFCKTHAIQNVQFMGALALAEAVTVLAASDVLVLPSVSETWGLVVNEAMLCEKPVIVSHHCGCALELVQHGQNGYIIDPNNVADLAAAMQKFVSGEADLKAMGAASLAIVKDFTPEKAASQIFAAISEN
ncbi:MAG: glycosyltransferase family 4 protein [Chitinophagaceae bacterium]|nr:glycosyltransferase family 4 protein [Chitinophagaceae bacterium]